jgi:chemotaxis protein MotB
MWDSLKDKDEQKKETPQEVIVIRRIIKVREVPHGGSWKVAYADFVTAMMAFFLLMWLLSASDQEMKDNLQQVFMSYKVFTSSGESKDPSQAVRNTKETDEKLQSSPDIAERLGKDIEKDRMQSSDPGGRLQISQNPLGVSIQVMDTDKKTPMFKSGESELTPDAKRVIKWLSERLNQWPYQIIIEGHTDSVPISGKTMTNIDLSGLRALAAMDELISNGLTKDRFLKVIGHGANKPLIKNDTTHPKNRRMNITILSYDKELNETEGKDYFE